MAIALRAVNSAYVNNANTVTLALPTGSAAGDFVVAFASHGVAPNVPSGWDPLENKTQANYSGSVFSKTLTAADITAGTVTVTFPSANYGHVALISLTGAITGARRFQGGATTGAASRTLTTDATPVAGEYALYYGAGRANSAMTETTGAVLASNSALNSSFILAGQVLGASGATTDTFGYPTVPTGDYQAIIVLSETMTTNARVVDMEAEVLRDSSANNAQIAAMSVEVLRSVTAIVRRRPIYTYIQTVN